MCWWLELFPYPLSVCLSPNIRIEKWTYGSFANVFISNQVFSFINISFKLKEDKIKDKIYQRICNQDNIFYNHFCFTLWQIVYFKICTRTWWFIERASFFIKNIKRKSMPYLYLLSIWLSKKNLFHLKRKTEK